MNNNRLTTFLGLISGVSELLARSGVLGRNSIWADGVFAVSLAALGFLTQGRASDSPAPE